MIKLPLKSVMAFLLVASASVADAQTLQTLCSFNGTNGASPQAALTLGTDGNFYGTTSSGGGYNYYGTVFKMTANGALTTLISFNYSPGSSPSAALTLGNDGNLYGTTSGHACGGCYLGTVFRVTTNGVLTTLVGFDGTNGSQAFAALALGNDGNFYGTTSSQSYGFFGTMFRVTTNGSLTTLVHFYGTNGLYPQAALTLGNDGNFYGTTPGGGGGSQGTVFRVSTNGLLNTLVSFYGTNGADPYAALTLGNDGNFYGTTYRGGGNFGLGTVFRVSTNGLLNTLVSFYGTNGADPYAALTLGNDGNFYGTTGGGGNFGRGTVFRLLLPPVVIVQPQSQTNNIGATVIFPVSATSLHPMTFQWQRNGTNLVDGGNLSGTTSKTLTITGISASDAASYSVIVSNANGSVTSSNATLTVIYPPIITVQPSNLLVLQGTNVAFGVSLTGSAPFFRYQWRFNGTNLLNATNAIYTIPSVATNKAGNYSVVITNAAGVATSSNAALTVVLSPTSRTNYAGSTATFTATAFSPVSLNYQWQKNGTNINDGGNLSGATNSTLTIASVSDADAAIYNAVVSDGSSSVTTSNAVLTVNNLPFIASSPQSQVVLAGSNVTFTASAYGAPPLIFQWYFQGSPVGPPTAGTNFSSYGLPGVGTNQAGAYSVQVLNSYGSVTSSVATLTVVDGPPTISSQPASRTNNAATIATFSVVATGSGKIYQWQQHGTNLVNGGKFSGATSSALTISSVSSNEAAVYSVIVTNLAGSVTSSNAILTVRYRPSITAQPAGQRVLLGGTASFSVSLSGTAPFRYQWRFNNANILDATNADYVIPAVVATNTGNYSVIVTNLAGSVTSSNALLTVIIPPTLALQMLAGYPLLYLNGMLGNNFVVQYNTNLAESNWLNLLSLTNLSASPYPFLDPAGSGQPARFYRAFMQ